MRLSYVTEVTLTPYPRSHCMKDMQDLRYLQAASNASLRLGVRVRVSVTVKVRVR